MSEQPSHLGADVEGGDDPLHPIFIVWNSREVMLTSVVVVAALALLIIFGAGTIFLAGVAVTAVGVAVIEDTAHRRAMKRYAEAFRALTRRVEELEQHAQPREPAHKSQAAPNARMPNERATHGINSLWTDDERIARHSRSDVQ